MNEKLLVRRISISANRLIEESIHNTHDAVEQLDLFTDYDAKAKLQEAEEAALDREKRVQKTMLSLKKKYGKNAIVKGMNLQKGATTLERNKQVGGHKE